MSAFDSTKTPLSRLLQEVVEGKIQLPDFQRGWVWDDEHIRSLLVSIARSFPIGAVMLLETGGEARFQVRTVEGVELPRPSASLAEQLILDGQQRLTSLTQVLKLPKPVATRDGKKRELRLLYYFDIEKALLGPQALADAIVAVDEERNLRSDFGRRIDLDLSTAEKEIAAFHFPCSQILDSSKWEYALTTQAPEKFVRFMEFRQKVLEPFRSYLLPVITLKRETSKEAVCLVFEKVNTGGVPLSVFELVTATWAADGFNLREDWLGTPGHVGRYGRLSRRPLLRELQPTDFLQGISLLHSQERREHDLAEGRSGKDVTPVTAKREHVLGMPLSAYEKWVEPLTTGFELAERFLRSEGFHHPKFLPYRTQLPPLAALLARIGERWLEPQIKDKLARWYWCGVLGELYGGAIETRIALDLQQMLAWIEKHDTSEPSTVQAASFNPNRLDTLRSRTSAAYRGLYILLQREGARDFFWKTRTVDLDRDEVKLDIHHIFPRRWCDEQHISSRVYDSIVNKTAISYKANRMIGGKAPSQYLAQIQNHAQVKLPDGGMDDILRTHLIDPALLRADSFEAFYSARKAALLAVVERAMGKALGQAVGPVAEDEAEEEDDEGENVP
ncbi:GmrSD restriction endonuclease domain-containing protein [Archangium lansingense]|uniref:GmrSD restriction endonuclease domain-containing protein n=1 Tax=Archangium lansingense TaxID=2995310 RepID=UPI003B7CB557